MGSTLLTETGDVAAPTEAARQFPNVSSDPIRPAYEGCIDSYGFSQAAGAWVAIGWMQHLPGDPQECGIDLHFARLALPVRCLRATFPRNDLPPGCEGVVILAPGSQRNLGRLVYLELDAGAGVRRLIATEQVEELPDGQIGARARAMLGASPRDAAHLAILKALSRQAYPGRSTLHEIGASIHMVVDETIRCGDAGTALIGWLAADDSALRRITLRAGRTEIELDMTRALRVDRHDVTEAVARDHGLHAPEPGFVLFVPERLDLDDHPHLQIEAADLSVGYLALPAPKLRGLAAMKRILETFSFRYGQMVAAYDRVVGPALAGLNRERLSTAVRIASFEFGTSHPAPVCSVIVPLYGRIDFMEYQLALFSREPLNRAHEFLYVLDDPSLKAPLLQLAETCLARFGLPFRILVLDRNVGYGPASNAGLQHAGGQYVCFLNSDIFPGDDRWIDSLVGRLDADPTLGAVGPVLLFEDGTVQHRGLAYEPYPEFGNWLFPVHPGKGMRPPRRRGLETQPAITGACLMTSLATAQACRGFDERFAIGDFEDSDLCLRIAALGLRCAVDLDVRLYHLERQSQGDMTNAWRFNLTLFNAWTHQNRWRATLDQRAAG
jgi:GT2 family glycosyltransferase